MALRDTIETVLLTGDILATRVSEQVSNMRWLQDILERPLRRALPDLSFGVGTELALDRAAVLSGVVPPDKLANRHCCFDAGLISDAGLEILQQAIGVRTLLIGYELSEPTGSTFGFIRFGSRMT